MNSDKGDREMAKSFEDQAVIIKAHRVVYRLHLHILPTKSDEKSCNSKRFNLVLGTFLTQIITGNATVVKTHTDLDQVLRTCFVYPTPIPSIRFYKQSKSTVLNHLIADHLSLDLKTDLLFQIQWHPNTAIATKTVYFQVKSGSFFLSFICPLSSILPLVLTHISTVSTISSLGPQDSLQLSQGWRDDVWGAAGGRERQELGR